MSTKKIIKAAEKVIFNAGIAADQAGHHKITDDIENLKMTIEKHESKPKKKERCRWIKIKRELSSFDMCDGTGWKDWTPPKQCPVCKKKVKVVNTRG